MSMGERARVVKMGDAQQGSQKQGETEMGTRNFGSLNEDLSRIGIDPSEMFRLAEATGTKVTPPEADSIDGPNLTMELAARLLAVDFSKVSDKDFNDLVEALSEKEVDESNKEIVAVAERLAKVISEAAIMRQVSASGKVITKHKGSFADRMKARKYRAKNKSKLRTARKRYEKSAGAKKLKKLSSRSSVMAKREKMSGASESAELLRDLRSLVGGGKSQVSDDRSRIVEHLELIFALLSEEFEDNEVDEILENVFNEVSSLSEDVDDDNFVVSIKPAMQVIKRLLEQIEGNR